MRKLARPFVLPLIGVLSIFALAAAILFERELVRAAPPDDPRGLAQWLSRHPADWLTAARLTEVSLDNDSPKRFAAWRDLHDHARRLSPRRPNANAAFVRAGLFHWYELSGDDRSRVLAAVQPLLTEPSVYADLYQPLWQLTRDLKTLRRISPPTLTAKVMLKQTAIQNGFFDEYRALRDEERIVRTADARKAAAAGRAAEVVSLVPDPLTVQDIELAELALSEFGKFAGQRDQLRLPQRLIDFALRHDLKSSAALRLILEDPDYPAPLRAQLALRLDAPEVASRIEIAAANPHAAEWVEYQLSRALFEARAGRAQAADSHLNRAAEAGLSRELLTTAAEVAGLLGRDSEEARYNSQLHAFGRGVEWKSTCGDGNLCGWASATLRAGGTLPVTLEVVQTDQVAPYVEVYVDDRLVRESAISDRLRLEVPLGGSSSHEVVLRLVNPTIAGGVQRRLRRS